MPSDNDTLLNIEKLSPQGNDKLAIMTDLSPDITTRYELYDNWNKMVAEEQEEAIGYVGWTVKHGPLGPYVYLAEVMVNPAFRRKGIATQLIREVEKHAEEINASYIYSFVKCLPTRKEEHILYPSRLKVLEITQTRYWDTDLRISL